MRWRTIFTDSESEHGVAPVCPQPDVHVMMHGMEFDLGPSDPFIYDECCIGPHIECHGHDEAKAIARLLTYAGAEICS